MHVETVQFYSEGDLLTGVLKTPDPPGTPWPIIVHGPGWMETVGHHFSAAFHDGLVAGGYAVLQFDYRGYGRSEGEPGWASPPMQQKDILNAITYVSSREDLDIDRLGLFAFGGPAAGNAVICATRDRRVKAICAQAVIADGTRWLREIRREYEWVGFLAEVERNRRQRVLTNTEMFVDPLDGITVARPDRKLRTDLPQPKTQFHLASVDDILDFRPLDVVSRLSPCGLLLCAVENDPITPEWHAYALFEAAAPPRRLIMQRGVEHHDSYTVNLAFLVGQFLDWYDHHLVSGLRELSPGLLRDEVLDYGVRKDQT